MTTKLPGFQVTNSLLLAVLFMVSYVALWM